MNRSFFTKKKIIWGIIIIVVIVGIVLKVRSGKSSTAGILTDTVKKQDLKQTVLATGQVVSSTNLNLSFQSAGIISTVNVKEGDTVKQGAILATLQSQNQQASLTSARGSLGQAKANYEKVLAGASSQDVAVAQAAVNAAQVSLTNAQTSFKNTQNQQATAVKNAYGALLNSGISALPGSGNIGAGTATITGTYTGVDQGIYNVSLYNTGSGQKFQFSGLENGQGDVRTTPVPFGTRGLFIQFSGNPGSGDSWTVNIPNTMAANYETNYNAYQAALQTQTSAVAASQSQLDNAQTALVQSQAALDLKRAQARPADVAAAEAQILSAQGQVQAAQAALDNTIIKAPAQGVITQVDSKVGEQATPSKEIMILQDVGSLHVEANISEANIATVKPGQSVDFTFDALGPDRHFTGNVQTVNPASVVVSGVVNYKVIATVENISEIKPGMTANMTVLAAQKNNVLAIPERALISRGTEFDARVVTNTKTKAYTNVPVTTGLSADGGLVEILTGLQEGQEIITFSK